MYLNIDLKFPLDYFYYLASSLFSSLLCNPDRISVIIKYITVRTRYVSANLNVLPEYNLPLYVRSSTPKTDNNEASYNKEIKSIPSAGSILRKA